MPNEQTISLILLATALASQESPSDCHGISLIADGINHAVPTHKEMQSSISWLIQNELVEKLGNKYLLPRKGKDEYEKTAKGLTNLFDIWKGLEQSIRDLH